MYLKHIEFIEWAAKYDIGSADIRSKAKHDEWRKLLQCEQIVLNGADDLEEDFKKVREEMNEYCYRQNCNRNC